MRAGTAPDHGSLALLAQNQEADLRPLLLRVHVRNFIDAPRHDAGTKTSFEAIALGLIPLVPDDALADAALMLRDHPDVPRSVLRALADQLGRATVRTEESRDGSDADRDGIRHDLRLAGDPDITLSGQVLEQLVERAMGHRDLARELLSRPEPSVFDRAALYRHGKACQREAIRRDLAQALAKIHQPRPTGRGAAARDILRIAASADSAAIRIAIAGHLGVSPEPFDLADAAGRELFLFALLAIGLEVTECIQALLQLGTEQSRSVPVMFHLAELGHATPWPVAAFLAGYERVRRGRQTDEPSSQSRLRGHMRAEGRADPIQPSRRGDRTGPDRAPTARLDRRS